MTFDQKKNTFILFDFFYRAEILNLPVKIPTEYVSLLVILLIFEFDLTIKTAVEQKLPAKMTLPLVIPLLFEFDMTVKSAVKRNFAAKLPVLS